MCPICMATTVAMVAAGAGSTGGLVALVARLRVVRGHRDPQEIDPRVVTSKRDKGSRQVHRREGRG
jgi:hypothetical protein